MSTVCFKYRVYPTKSQAHILNGMLDSCRLTYNSMIANRKQAYDRARKRLGYLEQKRALVGWKREHPRLAEVPAHTLQDVALRVDLAFQAFFRRVKKGEDPGYPRYKSVGCYDSLRFPQAGSDWSLREGRLRLPKSIGSLKIKLHRPLRGQPGSCIIHRYGSKWFACFSCEVEVEPLPLSAESVGIDVGLEKFASLSTGEFIENPRFFRSEEKNLAKAQRKLTKQAKGTRERRKAKAVVRRVYERSRNRRHDFIHQQSRRIVNRFGFIALEDLNVKSMTKRPKAKKDETTGEFLPNGASQKAGLNKSIADAAWTQFRSALSYKAANADRRVVVVNPRYTSQDCSGCGYRPGQRKTLKERWHFCPSCGLSLNRDVNAAANILQRAVGLHGRDGMPFSEAAGVHV